MKLLKGTINKLRREIEIKKLKIEKKRNKRDAIDAEIQIEIDECTELAKLIAENDAAEPAFEISAVGKAE